MQDPLKQGLKRFFFICIIASTEDSNARSIKTRIETLYHRRIPEMTIPIRMQDPLKQALKLYLYNVCSDLILIRMQDPLKQGLKPW